MIDTLKKQILCWTREKANNFHNNLYRDNLVNHDGNYIWEHTDNGIFLTRHNSAHYMGFDGIIHRLTNMYFESDWHLHQLLYENSKKYNVRVEIPIECKYIELNDTILQYSIIHRPNYQLGDDYHKELLLGKVNNDYFLEFIDQTKIIVECTKNIENNNLYPSIGFNLFHRSKDSLGYFWKDIKKWDKSYDELLKGHYDDIANLSIYANHNICKLNIDSILTYARDQWNITP